MQKYLLIADIHLEAGDTPDPAYLLSKKVAKAIKFSGTINIGDMLDFSYISAYTVDVPGAVEGMRLKDDFDILKAELSFWSKIGTRHLYLEGNHEARVQKYLMKNPVLQGVFDLRQIVEDAGHEWIPVLKQPYKFLPDLLLVHGVSFSKYYAAQNAINAGMSIVSGHAHRQQTFSYSYPDGRVITGYGLGTLGPINPDYFAGQRIAGHTQSISVLYIDDDGTWDITTHLIKNGKVIVEGKSFS